MALNNIDWIIIIIFIVILTAIGLITSKRGGKDSASFFLSSRNMPWWLLGISMVATTFSLGTPNLITDMVRSGGVARNWLWWAFLLSGMLTVFVYARLWSRSRVMTDLEFYEIRYSGKIAGILRGFRAVFLGFFFNVFILASASLAFIKVTAIMTNINPVTALIIVSFIILLYSTLGGLKSILWTDFFLFIFAMSGAFIPAYFVISSPRIGGMSGFLQHAAIIDKLDLIPDFSDPLMAVIVFVIPLTIQWWAAWYPGSEPGGGGYVAQRMLSAKSEKHAVGATLFFNLIHYAIRPWPWIIVGLASLIIFPNIESMVDSFQDVPAKYIQNDIAYPVMLREFLPNGILGLVLASLVAAYMSTISTQINWGASYLVNDFYARFIKPNASEREKVLVGRIWTIMLIVFSIFLALFLENALQVFQYMLLIGAGTGLIYILRWFWWRINAWSELSAMVGAAVFSTVIILIEQLFLTRIDHTTVLIFGSELDLALWDALKFVLIVLLNTIVWLVVTLCTKPCDEKILISFYERTRPGGPGWKNVAQKTTLTASEREKDWNVPVGLVCMSLGCLAVFSLLFSIGHLIYGNLIYFTVMLIVSVISSVLLFKLWGKLFD
ncbi:MAG: Na+:solute symporter [Prolixibacteraceae bacterium]|jgi:Na+/proline symporter|nr:Na+:solute symporter [Prolixibacteraceae bacterium]NLO01040.1 Na+:solute symporter [Bacteroidales bacterium]